MGLPPFLLGGSHSSVIELRVVSRGSGFPGLSGTSVRYNTLSFEYLKVGMGTYLQHAKDENGRQTLGSVGWCYHFLSKKISGF